MFSVCAPAQAAPNSASAVRLDIRVFFMFIILGSGGSEIVISVLLAAKIYWSFNAGRSDGRRSGDRSPLPSISAPPAGSAASHAGSADEIGIPAADSKGWESRP